MHSFILITFDEVEVAAFISMLHEVQRKIRDCNRKETPPKSCLSLWTSGLGLHSKGAELSRLLYA